MATTKLWPIKGQLSNAGVKITGVVKYVSDKKKTSKTESRTNSTSPTKAVENVIKYSMTPSKTEDERYISAINCSVSTAIDEMIVTKKQWGERGKRILWHGYQSFLPGEVTPEAAHEIGVALAKEVFGERFEVVIATHLDRAHIHNHFVINSVSFIDGRKLDWDTYYRGMEEVSDRICEEYKLSKVEKSYESGHYHRGAVRAEREGRPTIESIVIEDVDCCVLLASSLRDFYNLMEAKGYRIDTTGSFLKIYPPGRKRCIRLDRRMREKYNQGESYTIEGIERRILDPAKERLPDEPGVLPELSDSPLKLPESHAAEFSDKGIIPEKEVRGIAAVNIRYMYLMGVYPKVSKARIARTHYLLREDILKLDKYIGESRMLIDNKIVSDADLKKYKGKGIKTLKSLEKERNRLRSSLYRSKDEEKKEEIRDQIKDLNKRIKEIKKDLFYCNDIRKSQDEMKRKLNVITTSEKELTLQREL